MDDISAELEKNLPEGLEGYCKNNIEDNKLVMILSTDQENNDIKAQMDHLMKYLIDQWDIYSTIGVSSSYNHVSYMWKSYIEASTALDYRFIKGNNHVILFSELTMQYNEHSMYSSQSIENLSMCIKNGDFDRVDKYIDDLVKKVKENSSLFMARCACFDIINTIMRTVYDINKTFVVNDHDTFDLISLMKFETAEDLADTVKTFCFDICEYIQTIKSDTKHNLKNEINTYIDNHCCNLDFSIQATADLFKMSLSNLGQYFKSHTGSTISDYVCNVQIERAKELLKSSDESIQNIVRKVGHYDSSNFIRKFKQRVGMTPGEYRKMSAMG
jgi:YesN/AraC family two-component response regulator